MLNHSLGQCQAHCDTLSVSKVCPERQSQKDMCVCINLHTYRHMYIDKEREEETDFKKLAYAIVGPGKSECCRPGQQAGDQGRTDVAAQAQR